MKCQSAMLFYEEHLFLYDPKQGFLAAFLCTVNFLEDCISQDSTALEKGT